MVHAIQEDTSRYADIILDNITEGVFTLNSDFEITLFNRAAERITGVSAEDALGRLCHEVFRSSACEGDCPLRHTFDTGGPVVSKKIRILNAKGKQVPVSVSTALLRNEAGAIIGGVETFRDQSDVYALQKELHSKYNFSDIISKNANMRRIFATLPQIAESNCSVLIEGESGTGKELFARVIHQLSPRRGNRLVVVNCGALPDTLLESELFGYKAGAFTDAKRDKIGRFAQADRGTLLLDEIGDISPAFQTRLLRVLQDRTYEPLGSTRTEKADVRIIAASHRNLSDLVNKGTFRQDLYYRLNIIKLVIPPLRERKEDLTLLVPYFIEKYNKIMDKNVQGFSQDLMRTLLSHSFPGNIRELENMVEHAMVLATDPILEADLLPSELFESNQTEITVTFPTVRDAERKQILDALSKTNWNRQKASEVLGIHKTTLYRKIRALGIQLPDQDGRSPHTR